MSTQTQTHPSTHARPNPQAEERHGGAAHGTFKGYVTGFLLSVVLTAIPFWLVMSGVLGNNTLTTIAILALGVMQIFVHMVYFLHLNTKSESGWIVLSTIFTITLVVIMLTGSIWVMYHLNTNMMPAMHEMMHHRP